MEPAVFRPDLSDLYFVMGACAVIFVAMAFLAFRASKQKTTDPRRRVLLPMLFYFASLLALMGLLGSFWSSLKFPTVAVHSDHVLLDGERFPLPRRSQVRFEDNASTRITNQSVRILILQTADRRNFAFPSDRYPVNEMMGKFRFEDR